jgi:hypothetical protein
MHPDSDYALNAFAVGLASRTVPMFAGKNNCGESSKHMLGQQEQHRVVMVPQKSAAVVPLGDVLKIDTEGSESEILLGMANAGTLNRFRVVLLEWHGDSRRRQCDGLLNAFTLVETHAENPFAGIAKYVRTDTLKLNVV